MSLTPAPDHRATLGRTLRPRGKVLPEQARRHNRSLVLQTLYAGGERSRADIARLTGLTRVTVSDLMGELIDEGLVREVGVRTSGSRPGKPATMLVFDPGAFDIVGIDLSGHDSFRGALLDLHGRVLHDEQLHLEGRTGADAVELTLSLARSLVARATRPLLGVGIGSPGVVSTSGVVLSAPNLGWTNLELRAVAQEALGIPTQVVNDANAAVLAEHSFGPTEGDLMVVKVGHGVGAGLLLGGTPLYGSHFAAGEIGHVVVGTDGGRPCVCGKDGCLETWLPAPNLHTQIALDPAGDPGKVLREAGRRLGVALAPIVGALDLAEIVLSGPPDLLEGELADAAIQTLRDRTMADFHGHVSVRMSALGDDIVVQGAAVVVLSGRLGVS